VTCQVGDAAGDTPIGDGVIRLAAELEEATGSLDRRPPPVV
jgi:hypothetical protein